MCLIVTAQTTNRSSETFDFTEYHYSVEHSEHCNGDCAEQVEVYTLQTAEAARREKLLDERTAMYWSQEQ